MPLPLPLPLPLPPPLPPPLPLLHADDTHAAIVIFGGARLAFSPARHRHRQPPAPPSPAAPDSSKASHPVTYTDGCLIECSPGCDRHRQKLPTAQLPTVDTHAVVLVVGAGHRRRQQPPQSPPPPTVDTHAVVVVSGRAAAECRHTCRCRGQRHRTARKNLTAPHTPTDASQSTDEWHCRRHCRRHCYLLPAGDAHAPKRRAGEGGGKVGDH